MQSIVAVRYVDAFYSNEKVIKDARLQQHVVVGELLSSTQKHIAVVFVKEGALPNRGLLIPKESIVFERANLKIKRRIRVIRPLKNAPVGIFWRDLVYFENGVLPRECSSMYTKGRVHSVTKDAIVIKNPKTVKITPRGTINHPKHKPAFYVIPQALIVRIESHDQ